MEDVASLLFVHILTNLCWLPTVSWTQSVGLMWLWKWSMCWLHPKFLASSRLFSLDTKLSHPRLLAIPRACINFHASVPLFSLNSPSEMTFPFVFIIKMFPIFLAPGPSPLGGFPNLWAWLLCPQKGSLALYWYFFFHSALLAVSLLPLNFKILEDRNP